MTINGINGANTQMGQMGIGQATDSYIRNIQNQIANAQKQLQELSSNEDMTLEEKMKKRQEIQQQISDLNMQLRQHQVERRRAAERSQKQQANDSSMDDMLGGTRKAGRTNAGSKGTGLSQASMTAIISADNSMKQATVQGSVATRMEGRAGVLESEIKLDKVRGNDTQAKEEELAEVEQKARAAAASQLSTLADASRTMEEAAQADSETEKADNKDIKSADEKVKDAKENVAGTGEQQENISGAESVNARSDNSASGSTQTVKTAATPQPTVYTSVDIRL